MFLKIAVCDDEKIHRLILRDRLDEFAILHNLEYSLDEFCSSEELLGMHNSYDILFLDICLENGQNGIEAGKQLRQNGLDAAIILTTSFEQYAAEGYHLRAHRYLVKPIDKEKFSEAMLSCIQEFKSQNQKIEIKCGYESHLISVNSILYIESYQRKRTVYTTEKVYHTNMSLHELLTMLPAGQFAMPSKSFIVNLNHITGITKTKAILNFSVEFKLTRAHAEDFHKAFRNYLKEAGQKQTMVNTQR